MAVGTWGAAKAEETEPLAPWSFPWKKQRLLPTEFNTHLADGPVIPLPGTCSRG